MTTFHLQVRPPETAPRPRWWKPLRLPSRRSVSALRCSA